MTAGTRGSPSKYISMFASKLSPHVSKKEQCFEMFDVLYRNRKSFRSYVNRRLKDELQPSMRMTICREIRKHYTAWRFLEVLD
jgi:hypothetical protein